jgi:hypothetical protein
MQHPLNLLALNDSANSNSLAVAERVFGLSRGRFHFNPLLGPPESVLLEMNADQTIGFLDYRRINYWRRAEPNELGHLGLPDWTRKLKYLYLFGPLAANSMQTIRMCADEILADIPRFRKGDPVIVSKLGSAVAVTPAAQLSSQLLQ